MAYILTLLDTISSRIPNNIRAKYGAYWSKMVDLHMRHL